MNITLLFSSLTGILLSFILFFFNKGYKTANRYLAGFFFFISLFILSQYSGLYGHSEVLAALFASAPTPFVFLIGPLAFLYVRSVLRDNTKLSKSDYLHFILFVLQFIGMIHYYISPWEYKLSIARILLSDDWHVTQLSLNKLFVSPINSYLRPLHIAFYIFLGWHIIIKYYKRPKLSLLPIYQKQIVKRWLFSFFSVFSVFLICYCLISVNLLIYDTKQSFQSKSEFLLLIASISALTLNIFILLFPQILYGLPRINIPTSLITAQYVEEENQDENQKPHKGMNDSNTIPISGINKKLNDLYQKAQPWTDKNFSIATLAIAMDIPEHHLRYFFNHELKQSFSEYRNQLRVAHAKYLLQEGKFSHLSIEGIGALAGFASKSTFFAVFKKETGHTPKDYLNTLHNS